MASPLDSSQFVRLLDTRLREVAENTYNELPSMIPSFFRMLDSDSAWEEFYGVGAVPDIPEFLGEITYLDQSPQYHTKIEPKEYAGGLMFERKLIDDKKYAVLDDGAAGLMTAAHRTREKLGVKILTTSFSTAYDFMTSEEGVALCSDSHTTKAPGVSTSSGFDNAGTSAFSKTSVAATRLLMRKFKNDVGQRIEVGDDLELWVPDSLADDAFELVGTPSGFDTADSNKNMEYKRYDVYPWLRLDDDDANNWWMCWKTQRKKEAVWVDRIAPETKMTIDFDTYITKDAVYFRCAYGWIGWRFIFGQNVS